MSVITSRVVALIVSVMLIPPASVAQTPARPTLKVLISPSVIFVLPLEVGIEHGMFAQQGIDVQAVVHSGSSQSIIPSLARGDVDVATISPSPGFFNQFSEGFDAKLVASTISGRKGYNPAMWLVVRQDAWDKGTVRQARDLRGKHFDGMTPGSEGWYLARHVMSEAALQAADLTFTSRFSTPADWLLSLRNINDVQAAFEPTVTQLEQQHLGHRWISITDFDPGYQESFLGVSATTLKTRPDVIRRFLIGYINACSYVLKTKGRWTPELVRIFSKWSGLPPDVVSAIPSTPYTGAFGRINTADLEQVQRFWHLMGFVATEQSIGTLVDTSLITQAQQAAGVVPH